MGPGVMPGPGTSSTDCSLSCPQLYELDEDPKRKEFLDDLFSFMQKRGKGGWQGWAPLAPLPWLPGGAHSALSCSQSLQASQAGTAVPPIPIYICTCVSSHLADLTPFL